MIVKNAQYKPRKYARKLKSTGRKVVVKKAIYKAKTANIKKIVKSVLNTKLETKYAPNLTVADTIYVAGAGLNYNGSTNLNGWSSGPAQGTGLIPLIGQGASEGARIGNRIEPKSFKLKFSLHALPTTDASSVANTNPFRGMPFIARVLIYRHRYANDDFGQTQMLQNGNTSEDIGSTVDDFFKPYNRDEYYIYYSKNFLMSAAQHSNTNGLTQTDMESKASSFIYRSVPIKLPKHLLFNDGVTNQCTNAGMFMAVCVCNTDGSSITTTQRRLLVNAEANLSFTDA